MNAQPSSKPSFLRPEPEAKYFENEEPISFQMTTIDLYKPKANGERKDIRRAQNYFNLKDVVAPVLLFGVTEEGHSICATVTGFRPYIWLQVPDSWKETHLEYFFELIIPEQHRTRVSYYFEPNKWTPSYGFCNGVKLPFIRLEFDSDDLRKEIVRSLWIPMNDQSLGIEDHTFIPLEYQIPWELQFFEGLQLETSGWCQVFNYYHQVNQNTRCQINIDVEYHHLKPVQKMRVAPLLISSFDIECYRTVNDGQFPDSAVDPVIQIAIVSRIYGQTAEYCYSNVFCLDTIAETTNYEAQSFKTERELLNAWARMFRNLDTDVITGYNIFQFDLQYIWDRAVRVGAIEIFELGKAIGLETKLKDAGISSNAYASNKWKIIPIPGVSQIDMHIVAKRQVKAPNYKLETIAGMFLGEGKDPVDYKMIQAYQTMDAEHRRIIADYCKKDALLPLRLMFHPKFKTLESLIVMSRITKVPLDYLVLRGQSIKVLSQFQRRCHQRGYLVSEPPNHKLSNDERRKREKEDAEYYKRAKECGMKVKKQKKEKGYAGATVVDPQPGFYNCPIPTLDFASLYPSIMIGHNLCYITLVVDPQYANLPGIEYETNVIEDKKTGQVRSYTFVKNTSLLGILPDILKDLLAERGAVKKEMEVEKDPANKSLLNFRQLNLKLSANSMYGYTGAVEATLPCIPIAETVTHYGREMLNLTRGWLKEHYPKSNVIYGDTDSVMINFNLEGEEKGFKQLFTLAPQVAAEISKLFPRPCKLEFEKIYYPMLLTESKKVYSGVLWTKPEQYDYLDAKGFRHVKRDTCKLVVNTSEVILKKLMIEKDVPGAVNHLLSTLNDIHEDKIPPEQYVISMMLSRDMDSYHDLIPAHVTLARRLRERDPNNAPHSGDRIPYVAVDIDDPKLERKLSERIEDPDYAQKNRMTIDRHWYVRCQLQEPCIKLLRQVLKNPMEIFDRASGKQLRIQTGIVDLSRFTRPASAKRPDPLMLTQQQEQQAAQLPPWLQLYEPKKPDQIVTQTSILESFGMTKSISKKPPPPKKIYRPPLATQQKMTSFFKK